MRKITRSLPITVRIPIEIVDQIEIIRERLKIKTMTDFINKACETTLMIQAYLPKLESPEARKELVEKYESCMNEKDILLLPKSLKDNELEAMMGSMQLEKERRAL